MYVIQWKFIQILKYIYFLDWQRLRTAAVDSQFGVDEGVCDPYWWGCVDTHDKSEDYSLFKLTALASSALTEVNFSRCRLWPQCVVNSGEMRLQWLSTRHHFHCVSSIFSLIYFCSRTIAFHSLCALLCLWVSLWLNLFSSPLFMAVKGAIRYLWLFVLKSLPPHSAMTN